MPKQLRLIARVALTCLLAAPLATAQNNDNGRGGGGGGRNGGGPGGGGPGGGGPGGGGGRNGGNWGGGGPGGGGPGGGGPGGGTSPTGLVQNPIVQEELKMTDKQKEQVKAVKAESDKKRTQVQANADKMAQAANQQAAMEAAAAAEANGGNVNNGNGNGNGGNNGGRGGNRGRNSAGDQVSRQIMDEFNKTVETAMLKVLDSKQRTRVKQIGLQAQGVRAFSNPEVIQSLAMTDDQVSSIEAIGRDSRRNQGQLMGQLFNNDNGDNGGGPGGRGNRPDPATFQTPEFQAKLKTFQASQKSLDDQTMATVAKALTKAQRAKFQIMVGDKFDVAKLRRGFMDRFQPPGTQPTETASTAKPADPPKPAEAAAPKPAAKSSLRDRRGSSGTP